MPGKVFRECGQGIIREFTYIKAIAHWYKLPFTTLPFLCPGLKGPPGDLVVGSSVCLSVRNSFLLTYNIYSFGCHKVTKLGLQVHLRVVHISLTSHVPGDGVKMWHFEICLISIIVAGGGIRVSQSHIWLNYNSFYAPIIWDEFYAGFHLYWFSWASRNTEKAKITK